MSHSISRRHALASVPALGATGAVAAAAAPASAAGPSPAKRHRRGHHRDTIRFAMVADTHTDPENTTTMPRLEAVFTAIDAFDPHLVIHAGDVTEHGTSEEFDAFDDVVPARLRKRMVAVPGNHEARWDATAAHRRHRRIGDDVRVHDADGVRLILADTTSRQQEVAWWSRESLHALEGALQKAKNMPHVLVTHFPMGEGYYYVANQQDFEDVVAQHPIPLHLTGHTHREKLALVNRRDQLEAQSAKVDTSYYELVGSIDALEVTRVQIPDPADPATTVRTPVTTFDLRPDHGRDTAIPRRTDVSGSGGSIRITAKLPGSFDGAVEATHYDTTLYAGRNEKLPWTPLRNRHGSISGSLDAADLEPGQQRIHLRMRPTDDSGNRLLTVPFVHGSRGTAWRRELGGIIQSRPAVLRRRHGSVLVVGSSSGLVAGLDPAGRVLWRDYRASEVRHDLVAVDQGRAVIVPDTAGYLRRLTADGRTTWTYATGGPTAGDPATGKLGRTDAVLVCAGSTLHAVDVRTGRRLWTSELPTPSMGAPATDGKRVYIGVGDGNAHALDARTGKPLWSTSITTKEGSYQRFIYGPWNDTVSVLPDGGVVVSGIADAWCLEPEDGSARWQVEGSFQYAQEAVTENGDLLLANEGGEIVRVDPADGSELARHATAERVLDEGFVLVGDVVYTASHSGLISAVDLGSGSVEKITRLSTASVLAPGTAFGDLVVFADFAGTVHAVEQI